MATFSMRPYMALPWCKGAGRERKRASFMVFSYKDTNPIRARPLWPHYLITSLEIPSPNIATLGLWSFNMGLLGVHKHSTCSSACMNHSVTLSLKNLFWSQPSSRLFCLTMIVGSYLLHAFTSNLRYSDIL